MALDPIVLRSIAGYALKFQDAQQARNFLLEIASSATACRLNPERTVVNIEACSELAMRYVGKELTALETIQRHYQVARQITRSYLRLTSRDKLEEPIVSVKNTMKPLYKNPRPTNFGALGRRMKRALITGPQKPKFKPTPGLKSGKKRKKISPSGEKTWRQRAANKSVQ